MGSSSVFNKQAFEQLWKDHELFNSHYSSIIEMMQKALNLAPNDLNALTNLGGAYCDIGKHKEACVVLKKAIELGSKDRNTFFNYGVALINAQSQEQAKIYFKKANGLKSSEFTFEAYIDFMGY
jgi:tetratricopeptide (TPR) repeat protein